MLCAQAVMPAQGRMPPRRIYSRWAHRRIFLASWNNGAALQKKGPLSRPYVHKVEDSRRRSASGRKNGDCAPIHSIGVEPISQVKWL
jgi:hypothetical protein